MGDTAQWPGWIQAITGAVAAIFTFVAVRYAKQAAEGTVRAAESAEAAAETARDASEREREALDREKERDRRRQASQLTAWWDPENKNLCILNSSAGMVYDVLVTITDGHQLDAHFEHKAFLGKIPPRDTPTTLSLKNLGLDQAPILGDPQVALHFADADNEHWARHKDGKLAPVKNKMIVWADPNRRLLLEHLSQHHLDRNEMWLAAERFRMEDAYAKLCKPGGDKPDLYVTTHDRIADLVDRDLISPIELTRDEAERQFEERALEGVSYKGAIYGVPYGIDTVGLFANRRYFPHGVPDDLASLIDTARTACAVSDDGIPIALPVGTSGEAFRASPLLSAFSENIWDRGSLAHSLGTKPWLTTREWRHAFTALREMFDDGVFGATILDRGSAVEAFFDGRAPLLVSTSMILNRLPDHLDLGIHSFPSAVNEGREASAVVLVQVLVAPKGSPSHDQALDFLGKLAKNHGEKTNFGPTLAPIPAFREHLEKRIARKDRGSRSYTGEWYRLIQDTGELWPHLNDTPSVWDALNYAQIECLQPAGSRRTIDEILSEADRKRRA